MNHPTWKLRDPTNNYADVMGFIPSFLDLDDPRPAKEQLDANYEHGGGWNKFDGFKMLSNGDIQYLDDEPTKFVAHVHFRDETVVLFEHGWVAVVQPNGSFEIARMD